MNVPIGRIKCNKLRVFKYFLQDRCIQKLYFFALNLTAFLSFTEPFFIIDRAIHIFSLAHVVSVRGMQLK